MNREKIAWSISLLLIATLALRIPGSMAQRDDDYAFVRTLVDIHRQVSANYVEGVDQEKLRQGAIDGLLDQLDPFSMYVPPSRQEEFDRMLEGTFKGVGILLNQLDNGAIEVVTPIDGSPAFKAGVQAGDIILKVNDESLENLRLTEVTKKIAGPVGSTVKLLVRHVTGEEAELTMTREEVVVPTVKGYGRNEDNTWDYFVCDDPKIAYIRITQFTPDTADRVREAIEPLLAEGMKGLVLDLRFNPGGRLDEARDLVDLFLDSGVIVSVKGRNRPEQTVVARPEGTLPNFPMIVLANEHSASASEIVAGSLADNRRAVVIGTRTYGKGSVQEVVPLDQKSGELKLTVAYYYLPSGRLVHRRKDATDWGVQPQIVVPMDQQQEQRLLRDRYEQELFRRPVVKTTSQPTTEPTTQAVLDVQLQRAVDTLIALLVISGDRSDERQVVPPRQLRVSDAPGKLESGPPATQPGSEPSPGESADPSPKVDDAQPAPSDPVPPEPATQPDAGGPAPAPTTSP
jgi:carboxyl-terminal processing protease